MHKPAGLLVHRSPIDRHETAFALQFARELNEGERVYPLHRLDKPTSGILLFARDPEIASALGRAWMAGEVSKTYLAVVRGWTPESCRIDQPLRDKTADQQEGSEPLMRTAQTSLTRLACTELAVAVEHYPTSRYSLVALQPHTGRQHQLRRHLQHISHPIVGDTNYGRTKHNHYFAERFGAGRLLLAATELQLAHPVTRQTLRLYAQPETSFMQVLSLFAEQDVATLRQQPDCATTAPCLPLQSAG